MEFQFDDADFEPGLCFLVDTLASCIESKKYGWINEKSGKFCVYFVFRGLKKNGQGVKRKANNLCGVPMKVKKTQRFA